MRSGDKRPAIIADLPGQLFGGIKRQTRERKIDPPSIPRSQLQTDVKCFGPATHIHV